AGITIRHLLGNQSGLFDFIEDPQVLQPYLAGDLEHEWTPACLVAVSTSHPPNFPPGTATLYSNTDYTVAGMIIEAVTSNRFADEERSRITEPLWWSDTGVPLTNELTAPYAPGYFVDLDMQDVTAL